MDDVQRVLVRQALGIGERDVVWGIVDGLQGADDRRSISTGVVGVWLDVEDADLISTAVQRCVLKFRSAGVSLRLR